MKPTKTSIEQMFGPLADLTMENTAYQVAARRFDFGLDSAVCRHLVLKAFAAIEAEERRQGIQRVRPFTLRVDWRGLLIPVSLLDRDITKPLLAGTPFAQVLRDRREHLFRELLEGDPSVTTEHSAAFLLQIFQHVSRTPRCENPARQSHCGGFLLGDVAPASRGRTTALGIAAADRSTAHAAASRGGGRNLKQRGFAQFVLVPLCVCTSGDEVGFSGGSRPV